MLMLLLACPPKHLGSGSVQMESFEYAWSRIEEAHYDEDMNGIDWDAVYEELRPQARKARTNAELRPVLEDMFSRLGDSHYGVMPVEVAEGLPGPEMSFGDGQLDLDLSLVDGQVLVARSGLDQVGLGWVVVQIGDTVLEDWLLARSALGERELEFRLRHLVSSGITGSAVSVVFLDGGDERVERELRWAPNEGERATLGNLPTFTVDIRHETLELVHLYAFSAFFPPILPPWEAVVAEANGDGSLGLILDLRGNPGGVSGLSVGMASYLLAEPAVLGTMSSRDSTFNFLVTPRPEDQRFDGPVAVLIDGMSASTSEILAGGLQGIGRARVFGETSAGMALPSTFEELPNGDRIQLVLADLVGPNGERLEGAGVTPDTPVPLTREALLQGSDPVIEAATAWLLESAAP